MKTVSLLGLAVLGATLARARQDPPAAFDAVPPGEVRWEKAERYPAGVLVARVSADPAVDLLKLPAGTRVPLHAHRARQVVAVLSGRLIVGAGPEPGREIAAGGYLRLPARTPHWTSAPVETVVLVSGNAPHDLHWIRPQGP